MKRFSYALQPLLLSRQWAQQDSVAELAACQRRLDEAHFAAQRTQQRVEALQQQGRALLTPGRPLALEQMALIGPLLKQGAQQAGAAAQQLRRAEQDYEEQLAAADAARRALQAVERHRGTAWRRFRHELAEAEYRIADELWIQPKGESSEQQS